MQANFPNTLLFSGSRGRRGYMQGLGDNGDLVPADTTFGSTTGMQTTSAGWLTDIGNLIKGVGQGAASVITATRTPTTPAGSGVYPPSYYLPQSVGGLPTNTLLIGAAGLAVLFVILRKRRK